MKREMHWDRAMSTCQREKLRQLYNGGSFCLQASWVSSENEGMWIRGKDSLNKLEEHPYTRETNVFHLKIMLLKFTKGEWIAEDHTVHEWCRQNSNLTFLMPKPQSFCICQGLPQLRWWMDRRKQLGRNWVTIIISIADTYRITHSSNNNSFSLHKQPCFMDEETKSRQVKSFA